VIKYYAKGKDEETQRKISPQRLIFYRENWYLDAFCHLRNDLRSFAVDGIRNAVLTNTKAQEVSDKECHERFAGATAFLSGKDYFKGPNYALLLSTHRWAAGQHQGMVNKLVALIKRVITTLRFDFNQDPELVMDILKHGSGVEVIGPASLKNKVKAELEKTLKTYK
jgi:predicted DNA-binding transcriptional regulator YafY